MINFRSLNALYINDAAPHFMYISMTKWKKMCVHACVCMHVGLVYVLLWVHPMEKINNTV